MYDYLIVGAGLYGAVFAYEAKKAGKSCLVIEKRDHIGGNIYCEDIEGIHVHKYGAHIFHTSNKETWEYVNQFAEFNNYINTPIARYKDEIYNMPFNMNTFSKMWNIATPDEAKAEIEKQRQEITGDPQNLEEKDKWNETAKKVIYTGPIDAYFAYQYGPLEYRSVRFETEVLDMENYQGNAVVNYTEREIPYTRIIEHKHFEFGEQPKTVISREYPSEWQPGDEPYYPINNEKNNTLYEKYKELSIEQEKVIFGGRLGEYKYYDMDKVIESALYKAKDELQN